MIRVASMHRRPATDRHGAAVALASDPSRWWSRMNACPGVRFWRALVAAFLLPVAAFSQVLNITNGIHTYTTLDNTTVTMTGRSELHVTSTANPIPGCLIHLNSPDAWFFLPAIRPSAVVSTYLGQIRVDGQAATSGLNVRVDEYAMGSVVVRMPPAFFRFKSSAIRIVSGLLRTWAFTLITPMAVWGC